MNRVTVVFLSPISPSDDPDGVMEEMVIDQIENYLTEELLDQGYLPHGTGLVVSSVREEEI